MNKKRSTAKNQQKDINRIICDFVDFLMPELTPYEASVYLYLLRNTALKNSTAEIRIGKRTLALKYGRGARGAKTNYKHISKLLENLENKGCIRIGDTNKHGTLYSVVSPNEIPLVKEKIVSNSHQDNEEDYFTQPSKRQAIFKRDKWICQYCGEEVTSENVTLDHYIPQSRGGKNYKDNLRTCCLLCNAIKSGKTFDEAAPFLLKSIQKRKQKQNR